MMIKDYRRLMELHHICSTQTLKKCTKQNFSNIQKVKFKEINFDDARGENKVKHSLNWPYILVYPYRISIIGGFGSGTTNTLLI